MNLFTIYSFSADDNTQLPLDVHLKNQQAFIHGRDAYIYKFIPRVRSFCFIVKLLVESVSICKISYFISHIMYEFHSMP